MPVMLKTFDMLFECSNNINTHKLKNQLLSSTHTEHQGRTFWDGKNNDHNSPQARSLISLRRLSPRRALDLVTCLTFEVISWVLERNITQDKTALTAVHLRFWSSVDVSHDLYPACFPCLLPQHLQFETSSVSEDVNLLHTWFPID